MPRRIRLPTPSSTFQSRRFATASDPDLITACLKGEEAAWEALLRRYESLIYAVGTRAGRSRADAEDVFQDVSVLLLNHLENLRDQARLRGWVAPGTKRDAWRRQKRPGPTLSSEMGAADWNLETAVPVVGGEQATPEAEV